MKYWHSPVFQLFGEDTGVSLIPVIGIGGGICLLIAFIAIWYGLFFIRKGKGSLSLYTLIAVFPSVIGMYCGFLNLVRGFLTISWVLSEEAVGMGGSHSILAQSFAERLYIGFFGSGVSILLILFGITLFWDVHKEKGKKPSTVV